MLKDKEYVARGFFKDSISPGSNLWAKLEGRTKRFIYIADAKDENDRPQVGESTLFTLYSPDGPDGTDEPLYAVIVHPSRSQEHNEKMIDAVLAFMNAALTA